MGYGPGVLEDYFLIFFQHALMCGGFVWEWCDHGISHGKAENGTEKYFYGGDHGEKVHDGNFCMDGLVYPDRRIHTGLLEYKNVHRPARIIAFDVSAKEFILHNYLDFTDLQEYLDIEYEILYDGRLWESGQAECPSILPHENGKIKIDFTLSLIHI